MKKKRLFQVSIIFYCVYCVLVWLFFSFLFFFFFFFVFFCFWLSFYCLDRLLKRVVVVTKAAQ